MIMLTASFLSTPRLTWATVGLGVPNLYVFKFIFDSQDLQQDSCGPFNQRRTGLCSTGTISAGAQITTPRRTQFLGKALPVFGGESLTFAVVFSEFGAPTQCANQQH